MQINLKDYIKEVQDFPSKGIGFKDITPLLASPKAFGYALDEMSVLISEHFSEVNVVAGIEARGFIFASAIASRALVVIPAFIFALTSSRVLRTRSPAARIVCS